MKPETKRARQDALLDAIASGSSRDPQSRSSDASLHPGESLIWACVAGVKEAYAIRDAWAFHAPVTTMAKSALEELGRRCYVVFSPEGIS